MTTFCRFSGCLCRRLQAAAVERNFSSGSAELGADLCWGFFLSCCCKCLKNCETTGTSSPRLRRITHPQQTNHETSSPHTRKHSATPPSRSQTPYHRSRPWRPPHATCMLIRAVPVRAVPVTHLHTLITRTPRDQPRYALLLRGLRAPVASERRRETAARRDDHASTRRLVLTIGAARRRRRARRHGGAAAATPPCPSPPARPA